MSEHLEAYAQARQGAIPRYGPWVVAVTVFCIAASCVGIGTAVVSTLLVFLSFQALDRVADLFDPRRVTIVSFWFFSYLAMIYLPAFFVAHDQAGIYVPRYLWGVGSVLITVPVGTWIAALAFRYKKNETAKYFSGQVITKVRWSAAYHFVAALLFIAVLSTVLYFREAGTNPLLYMLRNPGEHLAVALLREESFKLLNSPLTYLYFVIRAAIYPFVICVAFGCWRVTRDKKWLWVLVVALVAGLLFASASAAKKPVAAIFLVWGLFAYLFKGGSLSRKAVAVIVILVLVFPFGVVYLAYQDPDLTSWDVGSALAYRMFYSPAEVVYYYFEVFPSHAGFLHGLSIDKLARLFGQKPFDTANYVGVYAYPTGLETVSANGAFIADLNADFGMTGVILGGVLAGFVMQAMQIFFVRQKKTVFCLAAYAFALYGFWDLNSSSLPIVLASNGTVLILLLSFFMNRNAGLQPARKLPQNQERAYEPKGTTISSLPRVP